MFTLAVTSTSAARLEPYALKLLSETPARSASVRQRQEAEISSFLFTKTVMIGPGDKRDNRLWTAVEQAVAAWQEALPDVPFEVAEDGVKPDVVVKWADRINGSGDLQGLIETSRQWTWGSKVSYMLTSRVAIRRTLGGRKISDSEAAQVLTHELGHLLGLDDVPQTRGVMGPIESGNPKMRPSEDEVRTLLDYRNSLRGLLERVRA